MLKIEQLDVKERSGRYLLKDISMESRQVRSLVLQVIVVLEKRHYCEAFLECFTQAVISMLERFCWMMWIYHIFPVNHTVSFVGKSWDLSRRIL